MTATGSGPGGGGPGKIAALGGIIADITGGAGRPGIGAGAPGGLSVTKGALAITGPGHWTNGLARTSRGTGS